MLHETSKLDNNKGIDLLHACGEACSQSSKLLEGAKKIGAEYKNKDLDTIFTTFKKQYYDSSRLMKDGNTITLIFEECTCPMVKDGVDNPYLCNCTVGHTIQIFKALFKRDIAVTLEQSILQGDTICKQQIIIEA